MFLVVFINYLPILIGCFNIIINFLDDISNLICTLLSRIYRYRLLITRTNNYLIASFILLFLLLIGIVINSLVYSCIIVFNCTSTGSFTLVWGTFPDTVVSACTIVADPPIKYKEVPNNTLAAPILSLRILNLCLIAVTIRFLIAPFLLILDYSHSLFFLAYLLKNNQNIFQ